MRHLSLLYLVLQFSLGSGRGFGRLVRGADMSARPARGRRRAPWPQACAVAADVRRASRQAVRGMIGRPAGGGASMAHPWMADRLRAGGAPISGPIHRPIHRWCGRCAYIGPCIHRVLYTGPIHRPIHRPSIRPHETPYAWGTSAGPGQAIQKTQGAGPQGARRPAQGAWRYGLIAPRVLASRAIHPASLP